MTSTSFRRRPLAVALVISALLIASAFGFLLARLTIKPPPSVVMNVGAYERAKVSVSRVVDSPGVSDCHPVSSTRTSLPEKSFRFSAVVPVTLDSASRVWGPRCVITGGIVKPNDIRSGVSDGLWTAPPWDVTHAGPGPARVIEVPGLTDCRPLTSPNVSTSIAVSVPRVAVIDASGRLWGPSCIVSSGVSIS